MGAKRAKTVSKVLKKNEAQHRRKRIIQYSVGGFLVFLMISSIFGVMLYADSPTSSQNVEIDGFTFSVRTQDGFTFAEITRTPSGKSTFIGSEFLTFPSPLFQSNFEPNSQTIAETIRNQTRGVYLTLNVSNLDLTGQDQTFGIEFQALDLARSGIADILFRSNIQTYAGITDESSTFQIPVITCDNATRQTPVLFFHGPSTEDRITSRVFISEQNPYCIEFKTTDFQSTIDLSEVLKFELVKLYE